MKRYPWEKFDDVLFQAATAHDLQTERRLLLRVLKKTGMTRATLCNHQKSLGLFNLPPRQPGASVIDQYEARMGSILNARLAAQVAKMRSHVDRSVSISRAASMLSVPRTYMEAWCVDLQVIKLDNQGKVPLPEVRRFIKTS